MMRERTRLAECRLRAGTRGGSQDTPLAGASTPPGAAGTFPLRSAAGRMGALGIRRMVGLGLWSRLQPADTREPGVALLVLTGLPDNRGRSAMPVTRRSLPVRDARPITRMNAR